MKTKQKKISYCRRWENGQKKYLPEALSPHTLQATKVFTHDDEFDEFESATDDVAALALLAVDDDVGENG